MKKTHEDFIQQVEKYNPTVKILGKYAKSNDKILCECKICKNQWSAIANNLSKKNSPTKCPICGEKNRHKKSTKNTKMFKQEMYDIVGCEYECIGDYISNKKQIKIKHSKCGFIYNVSPNNFLNKESRCPYCSNRKVIKGFNDIASTNSEIAKMLKNKEDGYKHTVRSNVCVDWICPTCKNIVHKSFDKVSTYGVMCPFCSDGISYPNKFVRNLFSQLNDQLDDYIPEYSPNWIGRKRYDNYFRIKDKEYILEVDGGIGHGKKVFKNSSKTVNDTIQDDKYKDNKAKKHKITVIRINADISDLEFMKKTIENSELSRILNLSTIDWNKCDIYGSKSILKDVCYIYMNTTKSIKEITNIISLCSYGTVYKLLLKGSKLGMCDYNPKDFPKYRDMSNLIASKSKKVKCLTTNEEFLSMTYGARKYNIKSVGNIRMCCIGKYHSAGKLENGTPLVWAYS